MNQGLKDEGKCRSDNRDPNSDDKEGKAPPQQTSLVQSEQQEMFHFDDQKQLSSIASFGQINSQHINKSNPAKPVSNILEPTAQHITGSSNGSITSPVNNVSAVQNLNLAGINKRNLRINSLGKVEQPSNSGRGVLIVKQKQQESPTKFKPQLFASTFHQNQAHNVLAQDVQEKLGTSDLQINNAPFVPGHSNSNSLTTDLNQLMMNSFDRQNLTQGQRCKSSARMVADNYPSISNHSNYDSGSNYIHNHERTGDIDSLNNTNQDGGLIFFGTNESINFNKQNTQSSQMNSNFFGAKQLKYHKNSSTNRGDANQAQFHDLMRMQMQKQNSYQTGGILLSPHVNTANQPIGLMLSAHSKKSANNQPNGLTMRSLKSQNSGGTQGPHTNRGESSLQQKSPHMSDVQDPYAYFNMHQQQPGSMTMSGQHTVQVSVGGLNQMIGIKKLDTMQISASGSSHQVRFASDQEHGVKSCRPNLYGKQQLMISQGCTVQQKALFGQGQAIVPNQSPTPTQEKEASEEEDKQEIKSDNVNKIKFQSPVSGTPFILNSSQIQFNQNVDGAKVNQIGANQGGLHSGNNSMHYYNNTNVNPLEKKGSIKGVFGFGSAGSGSRGSNFNSSTSTFPAAPVQKLSEVKNPQKLMSFRFVNRKASKISEISLFKNLQELDLSGNLLQEQVKELCCLSFLKRLSLCNNKITDMWNLPKSLEILNLSHNNIKELSEQCCQRLKNITTLDISNNKLETLNNFQLMYRIKRLLLKNNYVRSLQPLQSIQNIFEIDLEGNAIDSHKDFLSFIKGKNDIIIINLYQNPLMVEVNTIEKFNEDLIQNAPELVTKKTHKEIQEIKDLLGLTDETKAVLESSKGANGEETQRYNFHLIDELAQYLSFLKQGILYRNKRVFNKLKAIQLKTKRSASNYSNSSHHFVNNMTNPQASTHGAKISPQVPTQDRNSAKLTSPHEQNNGLIRTSNPQPYQPALKSAGYSPIVSIKSQRYEDVEAIYDNIVEHEELRRLKQKKIMAKKRKQHKQQMMSQLDETTGVKPDFGCDDSMNGSSEEFSSAELEDSDDLDEIDETLDMMEPREDFDDDDSLIEQEDSHLLEYQNFGNYQQNMGEEVLSQTLTSDLDADLHSYKKGDDGDNYQYGDDNMDDHDYLNGSTAGFGKKLREINREINQEQQDSSISASHSKSKHFTSIKKEVQKKIDAGQIKLRGKFDLNLDAIKKEQNQKFLQSDLKIKIHDRKDVVNVNGVQVLNFKKQIQTAKNSDRGESQNGDQLRAQQSRGMPTQSEDTYKLDRENHQQLNQSFSLKNICQDGQHNNANKYEVESLMMNKHQIQQRPQPINAPVNETTANNGFMPVERKIMQNSQSQNLNSQVNQSVNQSLLNDSMVQSVTHTSKPNFKLDLSKCKQDEEFAFGEESMHSQSMQSELNLSSIMLKDKSSSHLTSINQEQIELEDILLQEKEHDLDNMNVLVARDSYRMHGGVEKKSPRMLALAKLKGNLKPQLIDYIKKSKEKLALNGQESTKLGLKSVRNQTLAPENNQKDNFEAPSHKTERVEGSKVIEEYKCINEGCQNCLHLQETINKMNKQYIQEFESLKVQIMQYQQALLKIKNFINLTGDLEFQKHRTSKNLIKVSMFPDKVHHMFRRMYADLENQRIENDRLNHVLKAFQTKVFQQLATQNMQFDVNGGPIEYKDVAIQGIKQDVKSATYRNGQSKASIDITDSGTPEVAARSIIHQLNSAQINKSELEKAQQIIHSAKMMIPKAAQQQPKVQGKGVLHIKMNDIQKGGMPSLSSSELQSNIDEDTLRQNQALSMAGKVKKGAAKTMRNFPLSASESQQQQTRINSNPKIEMKEGAYHNYEANTFSSQYSLSQNQTAVAGTRVQEHEDDSHLHIESTQDHFVQFMANSGVKILKKMYYENMDSTENLAIQKKSSNTSRSRGKGFKKEKHPQAFIKEQTTHFDHASNSLDPKSSHKSLPRSTSKGLQKQNKQQEMGLQKSLEIIKQESSQLQNYKTSRIPTTTTKSFVDGLHDHDLREQTLQQQIVNCENLLLDNPPHQDFYFENQSLSQLDQNYNSSMNVFAGFQNPLNSVNNSAQIQTEKRKQKVQVNNPMVLQVPNSAGVQNSGNNQQFSSQRKQGNIVGSKTLQTNSGIPSVRPASRENKTQRLQRQQILNKSGAVVGGNVSSLQQTYDQDIRCQSINTTMGLMAESYYSKRPQSVAETGGRKFQKIQQQMQVFNKLNQQNSTNKKNKSNQKSKSKNKSTERNQSNRQAIKEMGKFLKNTQVKFSQSRVEQQVNNLSANIQKINTIKQSKYNTSSKMQQMAPQTSGRQTLLGNGMSKQNSAISRMDDIVRQTSKMRVTNVEEYTPLDTAGEPEFDEFVEIFGMQPPNSTGRRTTLQDSHSHGMSKQRRRSNHAVVQTLQGAPRKEQKIASQNEINLNLDSIQTAKLFIESMKQRNSSMGNQ